MKRTVSLKWFVAFSFLALSIALVVGYSLLSIHFFFRGVDNALAGNMAQVMDSYVHAFPAQERSRLNYFSGHWIASQWRQMPEEIRRAFPEPLQTDVMRKHNPSGWLTPPDVIHFVMRATRDGDAFFISRSVTRETASPLVGRQAAQNRRLLLTISILTAATMGAVILLLLSRVARPVKALGRWARGLNAANLHAPHPDFAYPELNELAELIRTSLSSVQDSLEREHRFLRHSSHELRTPISIIRNNLELLRELRKNSDQQWDPRQSRVIDRIDRASRTMQQLTETLLWLGRESEPELPLKEMDLEALLQELIAEAHYLVKDKAVSVIADTTPHAITIAETPARIVLGNLIRNAFQHTWHGTVRITQHQGSVEISNDLAADSESHQDLGFGLGLRLTEQLTRKLNWEYVSRAEGSSHHVRISL